MGADVYERSTPLASVASGADGWKEETDITVHDSVWKKIDFQTLKVTYVQDETEDYADQVQTDDVAEQQAEEESEE